MPKLLHIEFDRLKKMLLELSAVVEGSLRKAVVAIERRDAVLAQEVIRGDLEIDRREVHLEEECLKILALHQPVATDLRYIVAVLKLNNDLERIGDLSVNVAESTLGLADRPEPATPAEIYEMAEKALEMVRKALDSLIQLDAQQARLVLAADDEIDALNRRMFALARQGMHAEPAYLDGHAHFLRVSSDLERIADHATNIAKDVIYMMEGQIVRHRTKDILAEMRKAKADQAP
ncbi:MAG: phosphate signaling complex protein PhoU [Planctomycetota bacterium]|nr:phosphate signaling complex protein PhoU [Planctomycetota bacterium]